MKNALCFLVLFVLSSCIVCGQDPILLGRFYTSRSAIADTLFIPVEQEYDLVVTVYRDIDSTILMDNKSYMNCIDTLIHNGYEKEYAISRYNEDDCFKYLVKSHKYISLMYVVIQSADSGEWNKLNKKPIDVIYYSPEIIRDLCHESYKTWNQSSIGDFLLRYIPLLKFCLQEIIVNETTLVSKHTGNLLIDELHVVVRPTTSKIHYFTGGRPFFSTE